MLQLSIIFFIFIFILLLLSGESPFFFDLCVYLVADTYLFQNQCKHLTYICLHFVQSAYSTVTEKVTFRYIIFFVFSFIHFCLFQIISANKILLQKKIFNIKIYLIKSLKTMIVKCTSICLISK